jgi:hypothetical protein
VLRIDLTAQVIEVERDQDPDPLVILTTGAPASIDNTSDVVMHRNGPNWQSLLSDLGVVTRGMGGTSFRTHERYLVEEGDYSVRSYVSGMSEPREFYFNLRTERLENGFGLTFLLSRGTPSTWILDDDDPIRFDESPLVVNMFLPVFLNERTNTVFTSDAATPEAAVQRPTVWDRLDEIDDALGGGEEES